MHFIFLTIFASGIILTISNISTTIRILTLLVDENLGEARGEIGVL